MLYISIDFVYDIAVGIYAYFNQRSLQLAETNPGLIVFRGDKPKFSNLNSYNGGTHQIFRNVFWTQCFQMGLHVAKVFKMSKTFLSC